MKYTLRESKEKRRNLNAKITQMLSEETIFPSDILFTVLDEMVDKSLKWNPWCQKLDTLISEAIELEKIDK